MCKFCLTYAFNLDSLSYALQRRREVVESQQQQQQQQKPKKRKRKRVLGHTGDMFLKLGSD